MNEIITGHKKVGHFLVNAIDPSNGLIHVNYSIAETMEYRTTR